MAPLESLIEYTFQNPLILTEALTHASLAYERNQRQFDNQRLEFLGDSVLQVILSNELFLRMKGANEGILTKARSQLVSTKTLAKHALNLNFGAYLLMGRGEETNGGRTRESTLADVFEALTGAIFLDGGLEAARAFVLRVFASDLKALQSATLPPRGIRFSRSDIQQSDPFELNPKGELQEIVQSIGSSPPTYAILSAEGPDHLKSFVAVVSWLGTKLGLGTGRSKKEAESEAARLALTREDLTSQLKAAKERQNTATNNL